MAKVNMYSAGAIMADFRGIVDRHVDALLDDGRKSDALSVAAESWSKASAFMSQFVDTSVDGLPDPSPVVPPSPAPTTPVSTATATPAAPSPAVPPSPATPAVRRAVNPQSGSASNQPVRIGPDGKKIRGRKPMPDAVKVIKRVLLTLPMLTPKLWHCSLL